MIRPPFGITWREFDVLTLVCEGKYAGEIAEQLCISIHTVRSHYKSLRARTKSRTLAQAVAKYYHELYKYTDWLKHDL